MFDRDLQPQKNEYNSEFLQDYIRRSTKGLSDELKPDADASVRGLLGQLREWLLPDPPLTAATIRTEPPRHGAIGSLLVRHTFEFTLIFAIALGVQSYDRLLLIKLTGWCIFNGLTYGLLKAGSARDPELPLGSVDWLWHFLGLVTFVPLVSDYSLIEQVVIGVLLLAFAHLALIPWIVDGPSAVFKSASLFATALLVLGLAQLGAVAYHTPALLLLLLFAANYLLVLPFGMQMQHWFAAHRYATLEDVRRYSRLAERRYQPFAIRWNGACTHVAILFAAFAASMFYFGAICKVLTRSYAAEFQYIPLIYVGLLTSLKIGLAAFVAHSIGMCKLPRVGRYFGSFYVTWRCIAAWVSGDSEAAGPTAFRFSGLWSSVRARRRHLGAALANLSALALARN
jgi:hypothetical protein